MDAQLSIIGGEWAIIAVAALALLLGGDRLPAAARKVGRAVSEYNSARDELRGRVSAPPGGGIRVGGPVGSERAKLESICDSLGIPHRGVPDEGLRRAVAERMGAAGPGGG